MGAPAGSRAEPPCGKTRQLTEEVLTPDQQAHADTEYAETRTPGVPIFEDATKDVILE